MTAIGDGARRANRQGRTHKWERATLDAGAAGPDR